MKNLLLLFAALFISNNIFAQADIAEARTYAQGANLTVTGVVTNGESLGPIRYLQDATGGLPVYFPDVTETWNQGDNVTVTGEMGIFNGLIQVTNVTANTVNSTGNTLPAPHVVTPDGLNGNIESQLATVQNVTFADAGNIFGVGTHDFTDANGESSVIYVRSGHPLVGTIIPLGAVNMTGIVSVFQSNYQLLPRDLDDLENAVGFTITTLPEQSDITQNGFTLTWETDAAANHSVRYGLTESLELGEVTANSNAAVGTYTFTGLDAATFYYAQIIAESGGVELESPVRLYSTASTSSGQIDIYFNNIADNSVSSGTNANIKYGPQMLQFFKDQIDAAQTSIDVAVYNNNRTDLTATLTAAHERGVVVRYITDVDEFNSGISNPTPPFPIFQVQSDPPMQSALMHNKFMTIDVDSPENATVITGSMNWTNNNIAGDFNNVVVIQDQALAKAYTLEFEEMWGSENPTPGIFNSFSGENKVDNTPHLFNIGGDLVELYFSPSDNVSFRIENAVRSADSQVDFAILSFTFNDLGSAMLDLHNAGIDVRGMIENTGDQGTEFTFLQDNGVNVIDHPASGTIHHKYCIVDANAPNSDPLVITGSHNWSTNAEVRNDENTLIIHSETIANQFWQEFEARFAGLVGIDAVAAIEGFEVTTFPNPAVEYINFDVSLENANDILIEIYDVNGKLVETTNLQNISGQHIHQMNVSHLAAGSYFAAFTIDGLTVARQFVK